MPKSCALMLRNKLAPILYALTALSLLACGGQAVKPQEAVVPVEPKVEEVKKEPAPEPLVEVMPQKQMEEAPIVMEPIPAQESEPEPVAETTAEKVTEPAIEVATPQAAVSVAEAPASEIAAAPAVPVSAGPNHFVVTVGPKQPSHPAYGKGHPMGFLVNGVSGKELVIERGENYTFEIVTDPNHDVYLSTKAIGWGGTPYSAGVEGAFTYKGKMTLKASKETPEQLFYACRNHPFMGGVLHIVDKGQTVDIKQQSAATKAAGGAVAVKATTISQSKVQQKIMFAQMMLGAQGVKRVLASQNDEAKKRVADAKQTLTLSREKSSAGALPEALALADRALKMLSEATRLVPGEEEQAQLAENYKTLLSEIADYQKAYHDNIERMEKNGGVPAEVRLDEKAMAATLAQAETLAGNKNYLKATKLLQQAQTRITGALHKILDSKTIVYDLNFATAADEYDYELKRFVSYEELIPVAIEAKKPAPGAIKLMESFLDKARNRRDEAIAKAEAGDYPMAIAMLLQATKTVRRALRMVGVSQ